ncbi:MAG: single-stranded-DNA-specific exonuclease RecJ [Chloroflexota bacterium]
MSPLYPVPFRLSASPFILRSPMTHRNRWQVQTPITNDAEVALAKYPPTLRQLLFNRGYDTEEKARAFLRAEAPFDTNPFGIKGMDAAVTRIRRALEERESIAVYGDYDVDGVTATALLAEALTKLGATVRGYIPNRFDEGYGLNNEALTLLANEGVKLVVTVDCGIRSPAEALHARTLGLDLIVSDHHEPSGDIPDALAVINPKQPGDAYPEKYLAGVGLAYKIVEALHSLHPSREAFIPQDFLDLVALGTVADLAPLNGENRALVRQGLKEMRETKRQGLYSLAAVAGVALPKINAQNIGFSLGPRLNAAGRLTAATDALKLLMSADPIEAGRLAQSLNNQNVERQKLTREIQTLADALATEGQEDPILLFAAHPEFNHGVVGLAASRLLDAHYRPAIVCHFGEETTRCSCRSIPEFNITAALDECADLLIRHGGHRAAAGFTVRNENLNELVDRLRAIARRELDGRDLRSTLSADMQVSFSELTFDLIKYLDYLQPTGYGNPEAVFVARGVKVQVKRTVGADGAHLKLTLTDGRVSFDAIAFRLGHLEPTLPPLVDVMFTFETNEYNGRASLQLNVKDIKAAGLPD